MSIYYWLREDWTLDDTIVGTPDIGNDEIDFLIGAPITEPIKSPIIFKTTHYGPETLQHYFDYGTTIPVVSKKFVEALTHASIDNFETFPAQIQNRNGVVISNDYVALNILGMLNATDLDKSIYDEIMGGNDEGMPPLGIFTALALHEKTISPFDFFREPVGNSLVISERAFNKILECFPSGGIGIIAHEVILT